jgi:glycerate 2-kinase
MTLLETAKDIFLDALHHLSIAEAMQARVRCQGETLRVSDFAYDLDRFRRIVVVSIGKAAAPMADLFLPAIEPCLKRDQKIEAVVVGSTEPSRNDPRVRFFAGGHPVPNQSSFDAADGVLELLRSCDGLCLVFFLISGGASAMIERPLDKTIGLDESIDFYRALVLSGLPILQMNTLRKHFSQVKGGRLAVAARGATQCTLLISDVPENMLHVVGSGPSLPDPSTVEDCRTIVRGNTGALNFSERLRAFFEDNNLEETPKAGDPAFADCAWLSLLSSADLSRAAADAAARLGFHVVVDNSCDDWDYRDAATYLLKRVEELRRIHPKVCLLSAGEISVPVTSKHGLGGRNQQFTLECARLIAETNVKTSVLSGGSDGVDGNSPAAGGVCDETTRARALAKGLDVVAALKGFDSYTVFNALGDAIVTGATGNNVRDLRILLAE